MGHRLLNEDGGYACFRCGMFAESRDAATTVDCTGPETQHPPYLLADGTYETCAAHPYEDSTADLLAARESYSFAGWAER